MKLISCLAVGLSLLMLVGASVTADAAAPDAVPVTRAPDGQTGAPPNDHADGAARAGDATDDASAMGTARAGEGAGEDDAAAGGGAARPEDAASAAGARDGVSGAAAAGQEPAISEDPPVDVSDAAADGDPGGNDAAASGDPGAVGGGDGAAGDEVAVEDEDGAPQDGAGAEGESAAGGASGGAGEAEDTGISVVAPGGEVATVEYEGVLADVEEGEPQETREEKERRETAELCHLMTSAADAHGVPESFFIRLIWKESRFNPRAVSPVGAQGIAQFMPGTARLRGLSNPFDPKEALLASASFLADLEDEFGSWGLAAAGYNGGPNRVPPFVAGEGGLPYETIDYVFSITGRTADYWKQRARRMMAGVFPADIRALQGEPMPERYVEPISPPVDDSWRRRGDLSLIEPLHSIVEQIAYTPDEDGAAGADEPLGVDRLPRPPAPRPSISPSPVDCPALVARLGRSRAVAPPSGAGDGFTLWGAQVAGHPKRAVAMAQYARIKGKLPPDLVAQGPHVIVRRFAARGRLPIHAVQFGAPSRGAAEALCKRISKSLAPCVVVKNG